MGASSETKKGYCINCDNRHGCKSKSPPCVAEMTEKQIKGMEGRQYLIESKKTDRCKDCAFFRSCWNTEEFERLSKI